MHHARKFVFIAILALIAGCSSSYQPPLTYTYDKERVYAKPYNEVRQKVVDWFASKEIPMGKVTDSTGIISVEYKLPSDDFNPESEHRSCDCGKPGSSMSETQRIKNAIAMFEVVIKSVDDRNTKVIANINYKAELYMNEYGSETMGDSFLHALKCPSTGRLEKELMDFVGQ